MCFNLHNRLYFIYLWNSPLNKTIETKQHSQLTCLHSAKAYYLMHAKIRTKAYLFNAKTYFLMHAKIRTKAYLLNAKAYFLMHAKIRTKAYLLKTWCDFLSFSFLRTWEWMKKTTTSYKFALFHMNKYVDPNADDTHILVCGNTWKHTHYTRFDYTPCHYIKKLYLETILRHKSNWKIRASKPIKE